VPAPAPTPRTRTRRRIKVLGVSHRLFVVTLLVGALLAVAVPRRGDSVAAFSAGGWSTSARTSSAQVAPGGAIEIEVAVEATRNRRALVDLEIYDQADRRVFQKVWDNQQFRSGTPRSFTASWLVPPGETAGAHVVRLGVFRVRSTLLYHWNHLAATFTVGPSSATTTLPVTPSTTTTTVPAATTTTVPAATTTTTTVPVGTSTTTTTTSPLAVTTTTQPAATSTTLPPPAPTTPPSGAQFTETFESAAGFYDRFDRGLSGAHPSVDPNHIREWPGDHNMACEGPDTSRTVHLGTSHSQLDEMFWHCAPGGDPAKGHVMTSLNPLGYVYLWFSPKGYFNNVSQVCWDQNLTNMGGRKWTQVSVSTRAEVERVQREVGRLDLGFSHPGFQTAGGPTTGVIPSDQTVAVWQFGGMQHLYTGATELGTNPAFFPSYKIEDVATRYRHCMTDNGNGTITLTQENGSYSGSNAIPVNLAGRNVVSSTVPGSLPDGEVRVAFVDANYDPPKDGEYQAHQNTWHWDNVTIS
jgi:hypothetical protein